MSLTKKMDEHLTEFFSEQKEDILKENNNNENIWKESFSNSNETEEIMTNKIPNITDTEEQLV
jgi:subtilase family serine protease